MKQPPAFQFYPADFLADENVMLMSNQELGCYMKLMCYAWREGSIPSDIGKIAKLCGEDSSAMAQLWIAIGACFAQASDRDDRLLHPRLDQERMKQQEHRKERSEAGAKGAATRWNGKNGSAIKQPLANDGSSSSSSSSSESKEQKKEHAPQAALPTPTKRTDLGHRIPDDWTLTPDLEAYCRQKRPDLDPHDQAERFVLHWRSKAGKDARKTDWGLTYMTWIRNAHRTGGTYATSTPSRNLSAVERVKAANDRAEQRQRDEIDAEHRVVG